MKTLYALLFAVALGAAAAAHADSRSDAAALVGTWKVDLRPTPDADPYYHEFTVTSVDGKTFEGSFYGTPIENGRVNTDWNVLHFAFTTADGSGSYHSAGRLEGAILTGTTHALGREFLSVWTAERAPQD